MHYYLEVLQKYAQFTGRARRAEYWYFTLFNVLIVLLLDVVEVFMRTPFLVILYWLVLLLPALAVAVRRLHDTGRSGWWFLLNLIPIIGAIILIVWMATDSNPGDNKYGPNPKGVAGPVA